jgi:hypothetical protein
VIVLHERLHMTFTWKEVLPITKLVGLSRDVLGHRYFGLGKLHCRLANRILAIFGIVARSGLLLSASNLWSSTKVPSLSERKLY